MNLYEFAKKTFNEFISDNYDVNDKRVKIKLDHTYLVVENVKYICRNIKLDELNTDIALVIALLHDIGRFTEVKEMNTFREDITGYDHATLGIKFLFEKNYIRKFVKDDKYDEIIKTAIENHSKYAIEDGLSENILMHCKIIRDADKLDNFRSKTVDDMYTLANTNKEDIENSRITDKIYEDLMNEKTILLSDRKTPLDIWLTTIAFIFGFEFKCSYELVKEKDYVNKLFDRFEYKLEKKRMAELKKKALEYLEYKLK